MQRTTKFVKYLPEYGWGVSVLTVSNPSVPAIDNSLLHEIPISTEVIRARTLEPSQKRKASVSEESAQAEARRFLTAVLRRVTRIALQPDPQMLWNGPAFLAGRRLLRQRAHNAIVVSGPPFSSFLLGAVLSRITQLPLVLDYRDEWDLTTKYWENRYSGSLALALQRAMQRFVLREASGVIVTSSTSAAALSSLCQEASSDAFVTHIYNGYDPSDFAGSSIGAVAPPHDGLRLVYTGTLWNLTSCAPLVAAVRKLASEHPDAVRKLEIIVAGRRTADQEQLVRQLRGFCQVQLHGYMSHQDAIAWMRSAGALCLLLADAPEAGRVIPAKLFEYMASRKPILAIAPDGEVRRLLQHHPAAFTFSPQDVSGISSWLRQALRKGVSWPDHASFDPRSFDRREQTRVLASLLDQLSRTRDDKVHVAETASC